MKTATRWVAVLVTIAFLTFPLLAGTAHGRIDGRVADSSGQGQSGVAVSLEGAGRVTLTDAEGAYAFAGVPAQTYNLLFTLGDHTIAEKGIVVTPGQTANVDVTAAWASADAASVTVRSVSGRVERVVDAPAAVSVVGEPAISNQVAHGQLPKLLEFASGVEATQGGVYDYGLDSRGFNNSLNRRVATRIDGRDPSWPFLGAQEWAAISFPLDDLAGAEFQRGPSAALSGKNAVSGVLDLTTKQPRYSEGGLVRLTAGELGTANLDFRWAGYLFADVYLKAVGGRRSGGDFTRSREVAAEYSVLCTAAGQADCLPAEMPLTRVDDNEIDYGGLRLDKVWGDGSTLTLEGGSADIAGPVFQSGIGRVQLLDVKRPWARAAFSTDRWAARIDYTRRDAPRQRSLGTGANLALDTRRVSLEVRTNRSFVDDRLHLVMGALHTREDLDSLERSSGRQTMLFAPVKGDFSALFSRLDFRFSDVLKAVVALRWDDSSLHASRLSPNAALVWNPAPDQSLRLTYNEAFQVGGYSELFVQVPTGPSRDLSAVEAICTTENVDCGFGDGVTPLLAVGNDRLDVEEAKSWELGWSAILGGSSFVTAGYYRTDNSNFITDLIPQCGTALGDCSTPDARVNPSFGPYRPPTGLSATATSDLLAQLQIDLGTAFPLLTNNLDGAPVLAGASYANFGDVKTQGLDVALEHFVGQAWSLQAAYSWFDYEIASTAAGLSGLLLPNSPEHKASAGARFSGERFDGDLRLRWTDRFRWVVGVFQGDVESYVTLDLNANYRFGEAWKAGLTIGNLLDDEHHESFGGDLLGRRALGHVTFFW